MQENFEHYKSEMDEMRLTEESKKALAESLQRREIPVKPEIRTRKVPVSTRKIAAVAAVVCLLAVMGTAAVAQVHADSVLGNFFTGDQAGYDQASGIIGRTAECDGWIITITDCAGDDFQSFLGIEVEAPEGTVLDAEYYEIYVDNEYSQAVSGTTKGFCYSLPDNDPTDNKIRLLYNWYTTDGVSNHTQMRFKLVNLTENHGYLWDERSWDRPMVKEGEWDFGWFDIAYTDSAIRLAPMVELPFADTEVVLEELVLSPVGLYLRTNISTPYPTAWEDRFEEDVLPTVQLLDADGNVIPAAGGHPFGGLGASYFSFTDDVNAMNTAGADGLAELQVVDLERIASVSVAGVEIPVH